MTRYQVFDHAKCKTIGQVHEQLPDEVIEVLREHNYSLREMDFTAGSVSP